MQIVTTIPYSIGRVTYVMDNGKTIRLDEQNRMIWVQPKDLPLFTTPGQPGVVGRDGSSSAEVKLYFIDDIDRRGQPTAYTVHNENGEQFIFLIGLGKVELRVQRSK